MQLVRSARAWSLVALLGAALGASACADEVTACERLRDTGEACNITTADSCRSSTYPCGVYVSCGATCSAVGGVGCDPRAGQSCPDYATRAAMRDAAQRDDEVACRAFVDDLCTR